MAYFTQEEIKWIFNSQTIDEWHANAVTQIASFQQVEPAKEMDANQKAIWNARSVNLMSSWGHRPFLRITKSINRRFDMKALMYGSELLTPVCAELDDMIKPINKQAVKKLISDRWKDLHTKNKNPYVVPNKKNKMKFGITIYISLPENLNTRIELLEIARTALTGLDFHSGDGTFFVLTSMNEGKQFLCIVLIPAVYFGQKKYAPVCVQKEGKYRSRKTGRYCPAEAEELDPYCIVEPGTVHKDFVYFGMSTHFGSSSDTKNNCQSRQSFNDKSRIARRMLADTFHALGCRSQMVLLGRYDRNAEQLQTPAAVRNIKMYNGFFQRMENNTLKPLINKVKKLDDNRILIALRRLVVQLRKLQYLFIQTNVNDLGRGDLLIRFVGMPVWKAKNELLGLELRMQKAIFSFEKKYSIA